MRYFFTADEHYHHPNIISYCSRPFSSIEEMDQVLVKNFNEKVPKDGITIHIGDFTLGPWSQAEYYLNQLNGNHIFVKGNHDWWIKKSPFKVNHILQKTIEGQKIVCCHYSMRSWPASNYGSWQLFGHSHGLLAPMENQLDVGVDCWDYFPVSWEEVKGILFPRKNL